MMKKQTMLILDHEMYHPEAHTVITELGKRRGYDVKYRRYYPHFTSEDSDNAVVFINAGRTPSDPGGAMSLNEIPAIKDYVFNGGILVLAHGGRLFFRDHERILFNKLLSEMEIPVHIDMNVLEDDTGEGFAGSMSDYKCWCYATKGSPLGYKLGKIPGTYQCSLSTGEGVYVLMRSAPTAKCGKTVKNDKGEDVPERRAYKTLAAARYGKGWVFVVARGMLNSPYFTGFAQEKPLKYPEMYPDNIQFNENFVDMLIKASRGELDLSSVEPCEPDEMVEENITITLNNAEISLSAPDDTYDECSYWGEDEDEYGKWVRENKIRGSYVCLPNNATHENGYYLAKMNVDCGFNTCFMSTLSREIMHPEMKEEERERMLKMWRANTDALYDAGIHCFFGSYYPYPDMYKIKKYSHIVDALGKEYETPSPLDIRFWNDTVFPEAEIIARLSLEAKGITGIFWDMEMYEFPGCQVQEGQCMEDECFIKYLTAKGDFMSTEELAEAKSLDVSERYQWLLNTGRLKDYYLVLEWYAQQIGEALRKKIHAINPKLILSLYNPNISMNWFYRGMMRGLSTQRRPIVLITYELNGKIQQRQAREEGVYFYHAGGILTGVPENEDWVEVLPKTAALNDGYWIFPMHILQDNLKPTGGAFDYKGTKEGNINNMLLGNQRLDALLEYEKMKRKFE